MQYWNTSCHSLNQIERFWLVIHIIKNKDKIIEMENVKNEIIIFWFIQNMETETLKKWHMTLNIT